jgi:hypothetical protein
MVLDYYYLKKSRTDFMGPVMVGVLQNLAKPHLVKTYFGRKRLYHATSWKNGESIKKSGKMKRGKEGRFGAGIYFANSEESCLNKAHLNEGKGKKKYAIVVADVNLGTSLEVYNQKRNLNNAIIKSRGCDSVHGHTDRGEEFVVYKSSSVSISSVYFVEK